jgi:hypothetical protein
VALARDTLSMELAKVEDCWLRRSGMTGSMPRLGFGCYDRLVAENATCRMGNSAGGEGPIAWCDWLHGAWIGVKVVWNLAPFSFLSPDRWGNLLCGGWLRCHCTCSTEV